MNIQKGSTTNTLLILVLVIIVGFVVWYATAHQVKNEDTSGPSVELNLGGNGTDTPNGY